ncbi:flagellar biosynthesis protein FlhF [Paenibacillaceae bacterium]|nr:flagellar biosynthesis protein FlhF [Paenibacillaceae bacterium]
MRVKRYVVDAVPDALPLIRSELGKDAVILNTKEIRIGGFLGMFRKKKMEIIAAAETAAEKGAAASAAAANAAAEAAQKSAVLQAVARPQQAFVPQAAALSAPAVADPAPDRREQDDKQQALKRLEAPQDENLLKEIRQMKVMMTRMAKHQETVAMPESLQLLVNRLRQQEVAEEWTSKLLEEVQEDPDYSDDSTAAEIWMLAAAKLHEWLAPLQHKGIAGNVKVIHFVGPTGVGKTTTIAKLAAEQSLRHKRKVGFITSDTYRIAAVEQLRTYATILNVPLEVVLSPAELGRAFKQLEDCELLFMDTAGRNFRNELYVSEVNSLLQTAEDSETFLVLSLTAKSVDMELIAGQFAKYGIDKIVFTKRDETETCGAIVNVMLKHRFQPAYIAYGQNVPDDIGPFKLEAYVTELLGAPHE